MAISDKGEVVFDPELVKIERHRFSTTQGEVSLFYDDEKLIRYGDTITLISNQNLEGDGREVHRGWGGLPNAYWMAVAKRLFQAGDEYNGIEPVRKKYDDLLKASQADENVDSALEAKQEQDPEFDSMAYIGPW